MPSARTAGELRDEIYRYYVLSDGSYHHHPATNALRSSDGSIIDRALIYSCKQIAHETKDLHFKVNSIMFQTSLEPRSYPRDDIATPMFSKAGRYVYLNHLLGWKASELPEMFSKIGTTTLLDSSLAVFLFVKTLSNRTVKEPRKLRSMCATDIPPALWQMPYKI